MLSTSSCEIGFRAADPTDGLADEDVVAEGPAPAFTPAARGESKMKDIMFPRTLIYFSSLLA
jgi:hypothetical protein